MDYSQGSNLIADRHHDGNAATGLRGSRLESEWVNMIGDELVGLVEEADLEPDYTDRTQLRTSVRLIAQRSASASVATIAAAIQPDGVAILPSDISTIYVRGHTTEGIGGANYRRVNLEPTHAGKFQDTASQWWEINESEVTPMMFGASQDSSDNGPAINLALALGRKVIVPDGAELQIETSVSLSGESMHLHIGSKAKLFAGPGLIGPVVRCIANRFRLTGDGGFIEKIYPTGGLASPTLEGIVNVGPENEAVSRNINFWDIRGLTLLGDRKKYNAYAAGSHNLIDSDIGLKMVNSNMFGLSGSCYNGRIRDLDIEAVGVGIDCERVVQGNNFSLINFHRCTLAGFQMEGCGENSVDQTFYHFSPGITFVRLASTANDGQPFANRGSSGNSFTNLMGEPGPDSPFDGRDAQIINFGVGCNENYVQGYGNTGHGWTDNGLRNTVINKASVSTDAEHTFRSRPTLLEGVDFQLHNVGEFEMRGERQIVRDFRKGFAPSNPPVAQDVFSITSSSVNNFGLVSFDLLSTSAVTGTIHSAQFHVRFKTGSSNAITAEIEQVGGTDITFVASVSTNGAVATVTVTPSHPLHSNFIVMLRAKSFNPMSINNL